MNEVDVVHESCPAGHVTLVERVRWHAQHKAEQPFLLWLENGHIEAGSYTFGSLDKKVRALAAQIAAVVKQQKAQGETAAEFDAALIVTQPGLDFVVAFLACLFAGVAAVPAYPLKRRETTERLCAVLEDSGARLVN